MRYIVLFFGQALGMLLVSCNIRALARNMRAMTAVTEFGYALLSFFVLRKVAEASSPFEAIAYAAGATVGSFGALYITQHWDRSPHAQE
jgi:uncharacterized membrane protein